MLRLGPQQEGAVVTLRGPRGSTLAVRAPDGLEVRIPAPGGRADLWLPQTGEWRYEWLTGPGEHGISDTITVVAVAREPEGAAEPVHEPEPAFTYKPGRR